MAELEIYNEPKVVNAGLEASSSTHRSFSWLLFWGGQLSSLCALVDRVHIYGLHIFLDCHCKPVFEKK